MSGFKSNITVATMKQQTLFKEKIELKCGGALLQNGRRKTARPLSSKHPLHLVLHAEKPTLRKQRKQIEQESKRSAKRWGIRIYKQAIEKNHIHYVIKIPNRIAYRNFIQRLTGILAKRLEIKWRLRSFTRIANWGKEFKRLCGYVWQNELEAEHQIPKQPRGKYADKRRREPRPYPSYEEWIEALTNYSKSRSTSVSP